MPRPSLKTLRSQEILDAFAVCVGQFGLEGATLDRIAETAGVKRPILRHYLGNRDEMVEALIDHLGADFDGQTDALFEALPSRDRVEALLDLLFAPASVTDPDKVAALQAMVAASDRYPKAKRVLRDAIARLLALIEGELSAAFPKAESAHISSAAFGIASVAFNLDALAPLRPPADWRSAAKSAAATLVQSLEGETR